MKKTIVLALLLIFSTVSCIASHEAFNMDLEKLILELSLMTEVSSSGKDAVVNKINNEKFTYHRGMNVLYAKMMSEEQGLPVFRGEDIEKVECRFHVILFITSNNKPMHSNILQHFKDKDFFSYRTGEFLVEKSPCKYVETLSHMTIENCKKGYAETPIITQVLIKSPQKDQQQLCELMEQCPLISHHVQIPIVPLSPYSKDILCEKARSIIVTQTDQ